MSDLEAYIFEEAKKLMTDELKIKLMDEVGSRYVEIPFCVDGVLDRITFDRQVGKFTGIKYILGTGSGEQSPWGSAAYFESYKTINIKINI